MKKLVLLITYSLFLIPSVFAQQSLKDSSMSMFTLSPFFAYQIPAGDLAKRFGSNLNVGGSFNYKTQSNWIFGIEGSFIFGNDIKENGIFDSISTKNASTPAHTDPGYILGTGGTYSDIRLYERGYQFNLKVGKLIPVWAPNDNSGILITVGGGFLQHKIRIETPGNDAPQLMGDYKDGYDRRTNGFALTEYVGYQYLSNRNMVNFFAGFEFVQAFTQNRRNYNFDTMQQDNTKRFDALNGFKVGWIFPLLKRKPKEYYID